jgi:hypothetical protein
MTAAHLRPRGTNSGYNRKSRTAVRFLNLTGQQPPNASRTGLPSLLSELKVAQRKTTIAGDIRSISRASAAPDRTRNLSDAASRRRVKSARLRCRHQAGSRTGVAHGPGRSRPEFLPLHPEDYSGQPRGRRSGFRPMQRIEAHATSTPDDDLLFSAVSLSCTGGAIQGNKVWAPLPPGALAVRATQGF